MAGMEFFSSGKVKSVSTGQGLISKALLLGLLYLLITNVVLFSKQTTILLGIGVGIWILLR
jgi:hypothetical protein